MRRTVGAVLYNLLSSSDVSLGSLKNKMAELESGIVCEFLNRIFGALHVTYIYTVGLKHYEILRILILAKIFKKVLIVQI